MIVSYKYRVEMPLRYKVVDKFLEDIITKHFDELVLGKLQLLISPWFDPSFGMIILDVDSRCNRLRDLLRLPFNIEVTPRGYHLVSRFLIDCGDTFHWRLLKHYFRGYNGVDLVTSFSVNPIKRLGYDREKDFFYSFTDRLGDRRRYRGLRSISERFWGDWCEYILWDLIPYHTIHSYDWVKDLLSSTLGRSHVSGFE